MLSQPLHHYNVEIMAFVVAGKKLASAVQFLPRAVECAQGFSPCVTHPTSSVAHRALSHQLHTVGAPLAEADKTLPIAGAIEPRRSVVVFQHIVHRLVIALNRHLKTFHNFIVDTTGILVGAHQRNFFSHRHPNV